MGSLWDGYTYRSGDTVVATWSSPARRPSYELLVFFFQAEDGIRDLTVTGVQTCALPIYLQPPPAGDPEGQGQRYRLFEAVAAMLAVASQARPMLLVFDDVHWADKPTLLLLRHDIRSSRTACFTIVATYRESELGRTHPLAEMMITLRREPRATRPALRGRAVAH